MWSRTVPEETKKIQASDKSENQKYNENCAKGKTKNCSHNTNPCPLPHPEVPTPSQTEEHRAQSLCLEDQRWTHAWAPQVIYQNFTSNAWEATREGHRPNQQWDSSRACPSPSWDHCPCKSFQVPSSLGGSHITALDTKRKPTLEWPFFPSRTGGIRRVQNLLVDACLPRSHQTVNVMTARKSDTLAIKLGQFSIQDSGARDKKSTKVSI